VTILVGTAVFSVGAFLPYYRVDAAPDGTISLVSQMMDTLLDLGPRVVIGGGLMLIATTAVVVVLAVLELIGRSDSFARAALIGAAVTWSFTWAGALLRSAATVPFDVGYCVTLVGVAIVIVGTVIVFASARAARRRSAATPSDP
jgi:hypothetical protein